MRLTLRNRIFLNFVLVLSICVGIAAVLGTFFINRTTIEEEQRRVSVDLRSAWSVLHGKFNELAIMTNVLGTGKRVAGVYQTADTEPSRASLESVRRQFGLDFLSLTDEHGRVILRTVDPYRVGDDLSNDPFVKSALQGRTITGFSVLSQDRLGAEGGDLQERAFLAFEPTPKAKPRAKEVETSGLAVIAAAPIQDQNGHVYGTIYAGFLLNRNNTLVDNIRSLVFEDQLLGGRPVGTVTVFQWDVRVATNVILPNGNRAIGTRVSAEVYDKVLENNRSWYDRAFVVNDWYISAYDPIVDVDGKVIGILYVGVLAKKYDDIRRDLWRVYAIFTIVAAVLVVAVGLLFARRLTRTVGRLAEGTGRIAAGELDLAVPEPKSDDELKDLTKAFNSMAASLKDKDQRLTEAWAALERTNATLQQVNRNYLEMLGFVSHELKNTMGVIFTSAKALNDGLIGPLSPNQASMVAGIARNIETAVNMTRKYLDLTRIEKGELNVQIQQIDLIGDVIAPVLDELKQALEQHDVRLHSDLPASLPMAGDPTLLRIVFKNLLDNALKYGRHPGQIRLGFKREAAQYRFEVWNEGKGLNPDNLARLFGKFVRFRTDADSDSRGTGLGLFITKDIIERHGGAIRAESEEGQWINFIFILPVNRPDPPAVDPNRPVVAG